MKRLLVRRAAAGLSLAALAATGLASVPTAANAVVTDPYVSAYGSLSYDSGNCTIVGNTPNPSTVPWSDNGIAVSNQQAKSGTISNNDNAADITDASESSRGTITSSPLGTSGAATITASGTVSASVSPRLGASGCDPSAYGETEIGGDFKLAQPTWVTITGTGVGSGWGSISVSGADGTVRLGASNRSAGSITALLPAGDADVYLDVWTSAYVSTTEANTRSRAFTASFTVSLEPIGNGSAVTGKGKSFVSMDARSCPSGAVAVSLTKKAKKKAKLVEIKINGAKKGKKFQGKKLKKRTVAIAAPAATDATIVATITLKNGKKVTVTRSYLACS
jgi:hypothetical protein